MESKKDFNPPGWLITHFDRSVELDPERAQKFHDLRLRLCEALGQDNEACHPNNLWMKALDLLLAHEAALLSTIVHFDEQGNEICTSKKYD